MTTTYYTSTYRRAPIVRSGSIHVHYGQAYVESGGPEPDVDMDASNAALVEWAREAKYPFALEARHYRVRYSARWMDMGREEDSLLGGEPVVDWYLLELWPSPPSRDCIVTQTSEIAAYWHAYAQALARH